ncbi:hypothetical protein BDY21DRAFT_294897 [Lineolata rhizophorae]|uniref:Sucrose transport protein n=1 Tax=Lineolata rhizophorae TaxID=578093 RepID=A0A6A6NLW3_9PEZI|nr:hypothetical protein BDY21DRAFT_294897 [Lineolata rhizophorae]
MAAGVAEWRGTPHIKGSTETMRMALLTFSLIGLQFTWGIEMTYCTPYLLQLGLTKSKTSLVWIAGPLSGLVMQPVVGVIADRSTSRWGRRRPFMVGGAVVVAACLLVLGWTKELVGLFVSEPRAKRDITIAVAVLSIYGVDFAINAVQASCRSLVVDTLPISKQQLGSAWGGRMVAIGHLIGYGAGAVDLEALFGPTLGDTQFKQLTAISAMALCISVGVTCWATTERILISNGKEHHEQLGAVETLTKILKTATNLPPRIDAICWIQFWAWVGWFPFLFYGTTWVGEIYLRYEAPATTVRAHAVGAPVAGDEDTLGDIGRIGSQALIVFSIITFVASFAMPLLVKSPEHERGGGAARGFTPRPPPKLAPLMEAAEKRKPSLLTAWMCSHLLFAGSMVLAPFTTSVRFATVIVALCGIPWACQCWAPFTFMGVEINRLSSSASPTSSSSPSAHLYRRLSLGTTGGAHAGSVSGVYLGILNLYTTLPQFVGTFISWVVFSVLEPGPSAELAPDGDGEAGEAPAEEGQLGEGPRRDGPNAIAVCLFIGALAAVGSAVATRRLR